MTARPKRVAIIPARMDSTRLPGKPLADLGGAPVIQWVVEEVLDSGLFDLVVVASPDAEVLAVVRDIRSGLPRRDPTVYAHTQLVDMYTSPLCRDGTDRCAEVVRRMICERMRHLPIGTVVNVQADQPFVSADHLRSLVKRHEETTGSMRVTTLCCDLEEEEWSDESIVKVRNQPVESLWSHRTEWARSTCDGKTWKRHIGLYAYTQSALLAAAKAKSRDDGLHLEQTRFQCAGIEWRLRRTGTPPGIEVNTPADLEKARAALRFMAAV